MDFRILLSGWWMKIKKGKKGKKTLLNK